MLELIPLQDWGGCLTPESARTPTFPHSPTHPPPPPPHCHKELLLTFKLTVYVIDGASCFDPLRMSHICHSNKCPHQTLYHMTYRPDSIPINASSCHMHYESLCPASINLVGIYLTYRLILRYEASVYFSSSAILVCDGKLFLHMLTHSWNHMSQYFPFPFKNK